MLRAPPSRDRPKAYIATHAPRSAPGSEYSRLPRPDRVVLLQRSEGGALGTGSPTGLVTARGAGDLLTPHDLGAVHAVSEPEPGADPAGRDAKRSSQAILDRLKHATVNPATLDRPAPPAAPATAPSQTPAQSAPPALQLPPLGAPAPRARPAPPRRTGVRRRRRSSMRRPIRPRPISARRPPWPCRRSAPPPNRPRRKRPLRPHRRAGESPMADAGSPLPWGYWIHEFDSADSHPQRHSRPSVSATY